MDWAQTFGENVRLVRVSNGLTIEALAHDAKLSYSYVGEIERGLRNPTLKVIVAIAQALAISPDRLFRPC